MIEQVSPTMCYIFPVQPVRYLNTNKYYPNISTELKVGVYARYIYPE